MEGLIIEGPRSQSWLAPARPARAESRAKGSRFLADVILARSPAGAATHLVQLEEEFPQATHHCWAFRTPDATGRLLERCSDAGEPSGTAGAPILRALRAAQVEEASLVVVRWFGGRNLGVGPLGRAYRDAAAAALSQAGTERRRRLHLFVVQFPFEASAAVRRRVSRLGGRIQVERAGAVAEIEVAVPAGTGDTLARIVADATRGQAGVRSLGLTTGRWSG